MSVRAGTAAFDHDIHWCPSLSGLKNTVGKELVRLAQRELHCPLHAVPNFPFATANVNPTCVARGGVKDREYLNRRMGNRETHFDTTASERLPRQGSVTDSSGAVVPGAISSQFLFFRISLRSFLASTPIRSTTAL